MRLEKWNRAKRLASQIPQITTWGSKTTKQSEPRNQSALTVILLLCPHIRIVHAWCPEERQIRFLVEGAQIVVLFATGSDIKLSLFQHFHCLLPGSGCSKCSSALGIKNVHLVMKDASLRKVAEQNKLSLLGLLTEGSLWSVDETPQQSEFTQTNTLVLRHAHLDCWRNSNSEKSRSPAAR